MRKGLNESLRSRLNTGFIRVGGQTGRNSHQEGQDRKNQAEVDANVPGVCRVCVALRMRWTYCAYCGASK